MAGTWEYLITFLGALLILHFGKQLWLRKNAAPGPLSLPMIGGLWRFGIQFSLDVLNKLANQYGSIFKISFGSLPVVVLSGYQTVKEGLITHSEEFAGRPMTPFLKAIINEKGISFSNGHTWKQHKRFIALTMRKLGAGKRGMEHQIEEEACQLVEIFAKAKGQPFDPFLPLANAASRVICVVAFGQKFPLEDEKFQKLMAAMHYFTGFIGSFFYLLYEMFPWLMKHLPGPHKKAISCVEMGIAFAKEEIEKHKVHQKLHEPQDFIDYYLAQIEKSKEDPSATFDEDNLAQIIVDLFVGGTETPATTLQWALLLLATHPDIQDKVYSEMEEVLGSSHSVCYEDRKKLPYTNAVIHEVQRARYVLLFGIPRQSMMEVNMHGVLIPKGTFVIADIHSVLLDPKRWEAPKEFNPCHFLDKEGNFMAREEFLPFGAGARVCPGEQIARMELFLFFTKLLRTFRIQLPEGVKECNEKPVMGFALHPHPYKLCAIPRSSSS